MNYNMHVTKNIHVFLIIFIISWKIRNFSLLSFGEEAEEDEQEVHTLTKVFVLLFFSI